MLKKILIGFIVLVGVLFTYAALRPAQMLISREMLINASPEALFPYINNSKKAYEWMPWQESDPDAKIVYSGPDEGLGSKSSWESKGQMGVGEALVVESTANQSVKTQLSYTKPFAMSQLAEISLTPLESATKVKWSVNGHNTFLFRLIGIFMDCDKMVGDQFEKGLLKLKNLVETKTPGK